MSTTPKILIFGQSFNSYSGGGITLSNLFKGWPENKIAVMGTGHMLNNISLNVCKVYYQLGIDEQKWIFPFNLFQQRFQSGLKSFPSGIQTINVQNKTEVRHFFVNQIFYPLIRWLGLIHCTSNIYVSEKLDRWLSDYKPDILYLQVSTRETIQFAKEICDLLKVPSVIHMMDDWPVTISSKGLLWKYWRKRIDMEFRQLLDKVELHLAISNAMSSEYRIRYGKDFKSFHNPIEIEAWQPFTKSDFHINPLQVRILYSGRIGTGIYDSIIEVAETIDIINSDSIGIKLYIQSPVKDVGILKRLQKNKCVVINPIIEYSQLPIVLSKADILLLANDFNKTGVDFLKYSMPTKISEYMISGTPILVYSPAETAISKYVDENSCGCCVTTQSKEKLSSAIELLISNIDYRENISKNAVRLAKESFNADKVRCQFQQLLTRLCQS